MTMPWRRSIPAIRAAITGFTVAAAVVAVTVGTWLSPARAATIVTTVYVPDYFGGRVYAYTIPPTPPNGVTFASKLIRLPRNCSPNSVVVVAPKLYIACTASSTGIDQILVWNLSTSKFMHAITGVGTDKKQYFNGLIGMVLDQYKNLWISSYNNNYLLRVNANALATQDPPTIDRSVVDTPDAPAGLAVDPKDGSMWIVGQFDGGIVISLQTTSDPNAAGYASSVNQQGTYLGATSLNLSPIYCISGVAGDCSQPKTYPFDNPEGVAVFNGNVFVSNNGGDHPAAKLVKLARLSGKLTPVATGGTIGMPFSCPGGMFASTFMWVNDEDYGRGGTGQPATACGANSNISGDQGDQVGRVLAFTLSDLTKTPSNPTPEMFQNWNKVLTASPGFGGIFVTQTSQ